MLLIVILFTGLLTVFVVLVQQQKYKNMCDGGCKELNIFDCDDVFWAYSVMHVATLPDFDLCNSSTTQKQLLFRNIFEAIWQEDNSENATDRSYFVNLLFDASWLEDSLSGCALKRALSSM